MKKHLRTFEVDEHLYVRTTLAYLRKLRISKLISSFSKLDGKYVYLEGENDLTIFEQRHKSLATELVYVYEDETPDHRVFIDNLRPYSDRNWPDRQYAGFFAKWIVNQAITISKPDNIINNESFLTLESGERIEFIPTVYFNGRPATKQQLRKFKISVESVSTSIEIFDDDEDYY